MKNGRREVRVTIRRDLVEWIEEKEREGRFRSKDHALEFEATERVSLRMMLLGVFYLAWSCSRSRSLLFLSARLFLSSSSSMLVLERLPIALLPALSAATASQSGSNHLRRLFRFSSFSAFFADMISMPPLTLLCWSCQSELISVAHNGFKLYKVRLAHPPIAIDHDRVKWTSASRWETWPCPLW